VLQRGLVKVGRSGYHTRETPFEKWNVVEPTLQKEFSLCQLSGWVAWVHLRMEMAVRNELLSMVFVKRKRAK
jgi:hypothetical protein